MLHQPGVITLQGALDTAKPPFVNRKREFGPGVELYGRWDSAQFANDPMKFLEQTFIRYGNILERHPKTGGCKNSAPPIIRK